jgi:hypothetical protein
LRKAVDVEKIDYEYDISEERIRAYLAVPEIERLRWLEELCILTKQFREAPVVRQPDSAPPTRSA